MVSCTWSDSILPMNTVSGDILPRHLDSQAYNPRLTRRLLTCWISMACHFAFCLHLR